MSSPRLIHLVASNVWGGAERAALDLCTQFRGEGWSVTAYTRDARAVDARFEARGIDLRHAPLQGASDIISARLLARHLRAEPRGTIVHAHRYRDALMTLAAKTLARRPDIRTVVTRHVVAHPRSPRFLGPAYALIDAHIYVSDLARRRCLASFAPAQHKIVSARSHVITDGLRLGRTPVVPEPDRGPIVAMYHGRLIPGKGLETLIDALPRLKGRRTRLRIVGSGNPDYVDTLRRRAFSRGVAPLIDWHRYTPDVLPLIQTAHFGVTPSILAEAFGLPNIEYMAAGRPVITSCTGAQSEYITHGREGLLVAPADADILARAMLALASDADMRRRMGAAARIRFEAQLAWPHVADAHRRLYLSLL